MYTPLNYQHINTIEGTRVPSTHYTKNTYAFNYWWRSLYERALSVFDFKVNLRPDAFDLMRWSIYVNGACVFFNTSDFGLLAQPCGLTGINVNYRPTTAIVTNPAFTQTKELKIGKECEIVYISPDFGGLCGIIDFFAGQLAELSSAVNVAEINAKIPEVLYAENNAKAETLKKMIDKINEGNALAIYDHKLIATDDGESPIKNADFINDRTRNYILDKVLQDFQTVLNNFDAEIGIPVTPYQKRERMVSFESQSRVADGSARAKVWLAKMKDCFNLVNDMFDTDFSVSYNYENVSRETLGGEDNGAINNTGDV